MSQKCLSLLNSLPHEGYGLISVGICNPILVTYITLLTNVGVVSLAFYKMRDGPIAI